MWVCEWVGVCGRRLTGSADMDTLMSSRIIMIAGFRTFLTKFPASWEAHKHTVT